MSLPTLELIGKFRDPGIGLWYVAMQDLSVLKVWTGLALEQHVEWWWPRSKVSNGLFMVG